MAVLSKFFNLDGEKALAATLAAHIEKNLPAKLMDDKRHILSANKITRILEQVTEQVKEHQKTTRPNFIKRAILVNNLKWELKSRGYPDDFVSVAVESLVVAGIHKKTAS